MLSNIFTVINDTMDIQSIPTHYKLDDGRVWSVAEAKFVTDIPIDSIITCCPDKQNHSSLEGLIECLEFNNYPKGELKTDAEYASEVREKRNELIAETDFMMMSDYPLASEKREAVLTYRQSLRDIPEQSGFPRNINWPEKNF